MVALHAFLYAWHTGVSCPVINLQIPILAKSSRDYFSMLAPMKAIGGYSVVA